MHIIFYQKDGRIGAKYWVTEESKEAIKWSGILEPPGIMLHGDLGLLPEEIQTQGEQALREYAHQKAKERFRSLVAEAKEKREEARQRRENVNRVIHAEYGGVPLQGRITTNHNKHGGVIVVLEDPFRSTEGIIFNYPTCFGEAMTGARVFNLKTGELTARLLSDAADAIIQLYKEGMTERKHPGTQSLLKALNKETE